MKSSCIHTTQFVTFITPNIRQSLDVSLVPDPKTTFSSSSLAFYRSFGPIAATTYYFHSSFYFAISFAFLPPNIFRFYSVCPSIYVMCVGLFVFSFHAVIFCPISPFDLHTNSPTYSRNFLLFHISYSSKTTSKS